MENLFLEQAFLSDIELYFTDCRNIYDDYLIINHEEVRHITKVMRHEIDDEIYVTNGDGSIFKTKIIEKGNKAVKCNILDQFNYTNQYKNFVFCIPRLKSQDRFEFALEKCIELGITNYVVFESKRTVAKGEKLKRWNKIALAAMKQSLRSYLPKISFVKSLQQLKDSGTFIVFDQNAKDNLLEFVEKLDNKNKYYFLFGPEGGFDKDEINTLQNIVKLKLTPNRLRAETAVVTACSIITSKI